VSSQEDPLYGAEQEMLEHEVALLRALVEEVDRRLHRSPGDPVSDSAAIRETMIEAMAEDPEVRELVEGLAAFHRSRAGEDTE